MKGPMSFGGFGRIAPIGLFVALTIMAAAQALTPFLNEIGSHVTDAFRIWRGEMVCVGVYRLPLGYPGMLAPFVAVFGVAAGVKFGNFAAFAVLLIGGLFFLGGVCRLERMKGDALRFSSVTRQQFGAVLMLGALTLYPYSLLNASRASEALMAAALLVLFCGVLLQKPQLGAVIAAAVCLGFAMHTRANMVTLLLPAALWLMLRSDRGWGHRVGLASAALAALAATYALLSAVLAGCLWFSPTNGGYNLYAGNNPLSARYLAADQNAEYSIVPSLRAAGFAVAEVPDGYAIPQETYIGLAKAFAAECPSCVMKLVAQKTAVFFAPRVKNAGGAIETAVQYTLAAMTLAALALAFADMLRRRGYLEVMFLATVAAYALPFALTNADPRLRFPVDILALCYLVVRCQGWIVTRRYDSAAGE